VENMRSVGMNQDPISVQLVKGISADMIALFQNQNFQVQSGCHALGDCCTTEAGANNQTICFDHCVTINGSVHSV